MLKVDTETGSVVRHDFGNRHCRRGGLRPARGTRAEDDGYLAIFTFDPDDAHQRFRAARRRPCRRRAGRRGAAAAARAAGAARDLDREGLTPILMLRSRHRFDDGVSKHGQGGE